MEAYLLNICGRNEGPLYQDKTVATTAGPTLTITNKPALYDIKGRSFGFVQLTNDKIGHRIAAGDNMGNVYIFDFKTKRFWRICSLGIYCCTSLSFTLNSQQDLIIAVSNCAITVWNSESGALKKSITGHKNCIHNISINEAGTRALTSSTEEAIMWNLSPDLSMLYKLRDGKDINILKAFFIPRFNYIACAFKTSSVYLWDSDTRKFKTNFTCYEDDSLWLKTIVVSKDGKMITCGGKSDLIFVWSVETSSFLHKISFKKYLNSVFQILFLTHHSLERNIISVLDQHGHLHLYDFESQNRVCQLITDDEKIISVSECGNKLALLTSSGALKLYNVNSLLIEPTKHLTKPPPVALETRPKVQKKKKLKEHVEEFDMKSLKTIFSTLKEYPASHRNFIWSQLLQLPKNEEYVNFYNENYKYPLVGTKFENLNKSLKGTFVRQLSMLVQWCPFLEEVEYIPNLIFPFVSYLRKTPRMCFELLVTLISNWCQNWFSFIPFPPYNILCAVENLLVYHDRLLLHHFMQHNISSEVYAFSILRTSFSDIFAYDQWLKLWDHIFSNPPAFIIFLVIAFNMSSREILLRCETPNDFKVFYSQKRELVSDIIDEAYYLQKSTPLCFDPNPIIGSFSPLPQYGYSPFTRFAYSKADFQTLTAERILGEEIDHWQSIFEKSRMCNFEEVKRLTDIRRELLLQSLDQKEHLLYETLTLSYSGAGDTSDHPLVSIKALLVPLNTDELKRIDEKVKKIQKLIQENLIPQENIPLRQTIDEPIITYERHHNSESLRIINDVLHLREKLIEEDISALTN